MKAQKQGVLLDLYGTLVDIITEESSEVAWQTVRRHLGVDLAACAVRDAYERLCELEAQRLGEGFALESALRRLFAEVVGRAPADSEVVHLARVLRRSTTRQLSLRDYTLPLLRLLKAAGLRLALVSNTEALMTDYDLDQLPLRTWFDAVVLSSHEGVSKPNAAIFERAATRLGLPLEDLVHVGDTVETDGAGARAAGIDLVLLTNRPNGTPSAVRPNLVSIVDALRRLGCPLDVAEAPG